MNIIQGNTRHQGERRGYTPQLIVYHITGGTAASAIAWIGNPGSQVSYHFMVKKNGKIKQFVPIARMAWANGTTTSPANDKRHWSRSTVPLVQRLRGNANWYSVSIACEGTNGIATPAQFEAVLWLTRHIQAEVRRIYGHTIPFDRDHLVGHNEINPIHRAFCPGNRFPWDELRRRLGGAVAQPAPPPATQPQPVPPTTPAPQPVNNRPAKPAGRLLRRILAGLRR